MKPLNNLFLIDDDDTFVFLTKRIIQSTNIANQIKVFSNGKDAIDFLYEVADKKDLLPEVIFLDLSMPILDGWGFLEEFVRLKPKLGKKITIYIVSSSVSPHDLERAKNISVVSDFIIKPLTREKLLEVIKNL